MGPQVGQCGGAETWGPQPGGRQLIPRATRSANSGERPAKLRMSPPEGGPFSLFNKMQDSSVVGSDLTAVLSDTCPSRKGISLLNM